MLVPTMLKAPLVRPSRFKGAMDETTDQMIAASPLPQKAAVMKAIIRSRSGRRRSRRPV